MTLTQILDQCGGDLPTLRVTDWPDFPNRGLMLDISRDKVPTMETLYALVDLLASWKINQLQLYTEHTFAYQNHPEVWADASPMTGEEILALDAYCQARFVELVPNQNSFGHMHRWFEHERYLPLAEAPEGSMTPWGFFYEGPFSLAPTEPASLELVRELFDELLPHFSSPQFNVGCDETFDVGQGRSKEVVEEKGEGRVYLDFLLKIYREVKARRRTMQFWGDIIVHHPDLVAELPRDCIALEWGYDAQHPFNEHGAIFANSGIPFYVCPAPHLGTPLPDAPKMQSSTCATQPKMASNTVPLATSTPTGATEDTGNPYPSATWATATVPPSLGRMTPIVISTSPPPSAATPFATSAAQWANSSMISATPTCKQAKSYTTAPFYSGCCNSRQNEHTP